MSNLPERIWALIVPGLDSNYTTVGHPMWAHKAVWGNETEYIRADLVAEKDAEIKTLQGDLSINLQINMQLQELLESKDAEIERLKAEMYPAWRNNQAPYHRSDITGIDASGLVTIQCGSCKEFHTFYGMFRCFDCGMWLCRKCCWEHLGSNRHQPHPAHLHEYMAEIERLKEQVACGTKWTVQDDRVFHGQEVVSWKSDTGDWAFAYGIELRGVLAMEGMVTGFASEDEAFAAAESHCFEAMRDSVLGDDGL